MVPKMCIFNASAMEIVRKHNPVYDFDGGVIVFFLLIEYIHKYY